jgi:hypothetical protein
MLGDFPTHDKTGLEETQEWVGEGVEVVLRTRFMLHETREAGNSMKIAAPTSKGKTGFFDLRAATR